MSVSELDIPPVTTACHECKELGHFCRATQWVGDTENGICDACASGKDCAVIAAHLPPAAYEVDRFDQPAGPVREVPKEQWPPQVEEPKVEVPLYGRGRSFVEQPIMKTGATAQKHRPKIIRPCPYCGVEFSANELRAHEPHCERRACRWCGDEFTRSQLREHQPQCLRRPSKKRDRVLAARATVTPILSPNGGRAFFESEIEVPVEDAKAMFPYVPESEESTVPRGIPKVRDDSRTCSREGCTVVLGPNNRSGRCFKHYYVPQSDKHLQQTHLPKKKAKGAVPAKEPEVETGSPELYLSTQYLSGVSGPPAIPPDVFRSSAYGLVLQDLLTKREDLDNVIAFIRRLEAAPQ